VLVDRFAGSGGDGISPAQRSRALYLLTGWVLVSPLARTIAALLAVRDHVIGPHPGRCPQPRLGRKAAQWTAIDRDYETLRIGMQALFADLGITTSSAAA
jgi:hypothetical protein